MLDDYHYHEYELPSTLESLTVYGVECSVCAIRLRRLGATLRPRVINFAWNNKPTKDQDVWYVM